MDTTIPELQRRLVFALLRPAARLCARLRMPLKLVEQLCRLAYFEELRRTGDGSHAEIAEVFQKSLRTVGTLERQYRSGFLEPQREIELCRRIEDALQDRPMRPDELIEQYPDAGPVLKLLLAAKRVHRDDDGRYVLNRRFVSVMRDDLDARIGGLIHQLDIITETVRERFLQAGEPRPSVARTLTFAGTPKEMEELSVALSRTVRALCVDAEERSLSQEGWSNYAVIFALTPTEQED